MTQTELRELLLGGRYAYSISEVAKAVGVGRTFLYREIQDRRLRIRKAGRRSLVYEADLRAWLEALPEK
ncbi:excisionase family DNA-binding protein [Bradyrhizobium sp. Mp27]|uniref:excisionase family DNA-binding protein n=1 Tax=Bradyrhizobium sp. Mp27 TaxID=3042157 RepID=UPI00248B4F00|nr:excisionase family DNA-binding protein [Bradyrhizobium sp. Mp27]MDI2073040.1 excisionase family DNA-binding protein [Bradyrhizobium sp. Mp27]